MACDAVSDEGVAGESADVSTVLERAWDASSADGFDRMRKKTSMATMERMATPPTTPPTIAPVEAEDPDSVVVRGSLGLAGTVRFFDE